LSNVVGGRLVLHEELYLFFYRFRTALLCPQLTNIRATHAQICLFLKVILTVKISFLLLKSDAVFSPLQESPLSDKLWKLDPS